MEFEIKDEVIAYLGDDYDESMDVKIEALIHRAIQRFKSYRKYPKTYTDSMIESDMSKYCACLYDLVIYWIAKEGAEFESFHIENGVQRAYISENSIFSLHCIHPIATLI